MVGNTASNDTLQDNVVHSVCGILQCPMRGTLWSAEVSPVRQLAVHWDSVRMSPVADRQHTVSV